MGFGNWLTNLALGSVPAADPADHDCARRAYADFLKAQLAGYGPDGSQEFKDFAAEIIAKDRLKPVEGESTTANFATVMGIETRMTGLMTDDQVARNYWVVRDRFNRVAGATGIAEHSRWTSPDLRDVATNGSAAPLAIARRAATAAWAKAGEAAALFTQAKADAGDRPDEAGAAAISAAEAALTLALTEGRAASEHVDDLTAAAACKPAADTTLDGKTRGTDDA